MNQVEQHIKVRNVMSNKQFATVRHHDTWRDLRISGDPLQTADQRRCVCCGALEYEVEHD